MCGVAGIYSKGSENIKPQLIKLMVSSIKHRGPDFQNFWQNENISLGHARLSIIDLSARANQPMVSFDNRYVIVYNGEIYNFLILRKEISSLGIEFKTKSDTEVIANGFSIWRENLFQKLNGIFSIGIYDKSENTLTLARDRFGVKPLYILSVDKLLYFCSEIKGILSVYNSIKLNAEALHEYSFFGNALQDKTFFEGIKNLNPGCYVKIKDNQIKKEKFWEIKKRIFKKYNEEKVVESINQLVGNGIKNQLVSDVPVGIFLSGGLDSTAITHFAAKNSNKNINTYTASFEFMPNSNNEIKKARKIAKHYGTNHNEIFISTDNLLDVIDKLVQQHDEPFADAANIPLYLMTKEIKSEIKVVLQGDGGDEIFGGYNRYSILKKKSIFKLLSRILPYKYLKIFQSQRLKSIQRILEIFSKDRGMDMFPLLLTMDTENNCLSNLFSKTIKEKLVSNIPFQEYNNLSVDFEGYDDVNKMLFIDTKILLSDTFLKKVDIATMANGIESRVPFLDNELTDYMLKIPSDLKIKGGKKKYLLKKALQQSVPNHLLVGKKFGFGVPYAEWLHSPLKKYSKDLILSYSVGSRSIFNEKKMSEKLINFHDNFNYQDGYIIWKAFILSLWLEKVNFKKNICSLF
tara:strand:+ start:522 stop:2417 length:1896 start_codon:yes stop_codon:yes gene_type:complete